MKKIFWTTVFWLLVIFLFRSYVRLFNTSLGRSVGSRFGVSQQVCLTGSVDNGIAQQLGDIQNQLTVINGKIQSDSQVSVQDSLFQTNVPTRVALYYFNQTADQKLPPEQQINIDSLMPVYRMFPASKNLLVDTITELIKGNLTANERQQ